MTTAIKNRASITSGADRRLRHHLARIANDAARPVPQEGAILFEAETSWQLSIAAYDAVVVKTGQYVFGFGSDFQLAGGTEVLLIDDTSTIESPVDQFLNEVYRCQNEDEIRSGIRYIFSELNDWLTSGSYATCDAILENVDVDKLNADLILSFLTITRAARDKLDSRTEYLEKARSRITKLRGARVAEKLLRHMAD